MNTAVLSWPWFDSTIYPWLSKPHWPSVSGDPSPPPWLSKPWWPSWGIGRLASDTSAFISRMFGPWPITSTIEDPTCPPEPILSTDPTDGLPFKVSADPSTPSYILGPGGVPIQKGGEFDSTIEAWRDSGVQESDTSGWISRIFGPGIGPILQKGGENDYVDSGDGIV